MSSQSVSFVKTANILYRIQLEAASKKLLKLMQMFFKDSLLDFVLIAFPIFGIWGHRYKITEWRFKACSPQWSFCEMNRFQMFRNPATLLSDLQFEKIKSY